MRKYGVLEGLCCRCGVVSRTELCAPCIIATEDEDREVDSVLSPVDYLNPLAQVEGIEVVVIID